ncbi:hypothetical protein MNBD_GAMMA23-1878 [hydrothermal vent metagenome]|uniref:Uncharacterized protein n=1 Tax=hydrothermal vent metagenome TaxID=652676 RepID=A0A3B1A9N3_9ZZZZ
MSIFGRRLVSFFTLVLLIIFVANCGGGGGTGSTTTPGSNTNSQYSITLDFARVDSVGLDLFQVTATILNNGSPATGLSQNITVDLERGTRGAITESTNGQYQFTVTPTQTGEHVVTVSYLSTSTQRMALVLANVHTDWGQPMAVSGLVNTEGYEDGITVTPDGEYLFVQYGPIYFSGLILYQTARSSGGCGGSRLTPDRCTHTWIDDVKGPITAPERPGFYTGRIANGKNLHNANSWGVGVEQAPNFAVSTMFYGFKRQADGTYKEPFYLAFDDEADGIIGPYGLSFLNNADGSTTVAFAMDDPSNPDMVDLAGDGSIIVESLTDVFTLDLTLGSNTSLGKFVPSGTAGTAPVRDSFFPSKLIDFGKIGINGIAGTQGNPHLYAESGAVKSVWTDDERDTGGDRGEISAYVLNSGTLLSGSWTKVVLPTVVNKASPSDEIQPFFTSTGLYYTHISSTDLPEIYFNAYSGASLVADYSNAANWGVTQTILGVGAADSLGKITALGEPTLATINGIEYLYFVYGYIRGYDAVSGLADINMQAGYIKKK